MLQEIHVKDLGVVEEVSLPLGPGMTALTGETGAGKTLLVEALVAALGGRTSPALVRQDAAEALVEARFDGPDEEQVLARAVPAAGRSRAWVDGRMATVATLSERGAALVDVHGQHERHSLLSAAGQRRALDAWGGLDDRPVRAARQELRRLDQERESLGGEPQARARHLEMLAFQVREIDQAGLHDPEEDDKLRAEEELLADATAHREAAIAALAALGGGHLPDLGEGGAGGEEVGALEHIDRATSLLAGRGPWAAWAIRLQGSRAELDDVAADLRAAAEGLEDDPARLMEVQERRRRLTELRRKYGTTLADVTAFAEERRAELQALESAEERLAELDQLRCRRADELSRLEDELGAARRAAAEGLGTSVSARLDDLAMAGAKLVVEVGSAPAGEDVRFLLAANPGEAARPLARVASGGELARTTLALRLVAEGGPGTLLFDEVDAGVGGEAALALAGALRDLARCRQVLVVTHLPQVAAFADHQVAVHKGLRGARTVTEVTPVVDEERVVELARMLSGHPDSSSARAHARDLLVRGAR